MSTVVKIKQFSQVNDLTQFMTLGNICNATYMTTMTGVSLYFIKTTFETNVRANAMWDMKRQDNKDNKYNININADKI
jgi:hypothetical protein